MKEYVKQFESIRWLVEGYYDVQKLRIQTFNRLNKKCLKCNENDKLTFRKKTKEWFCKRCKIKVPTITAEKELEEYWIKLQETEDKLNKDLVTWVKRFDIYNDYLRNIRGIGHILSAGLIAWSFPIERFERVSRLWSYCGLSAKHYAQECSGKGKKKHKFISARARTSCPVRNQKTGKVCGKPILKTEESRSRKKGYLLMYNPRMKTFCWKIGSSFIKQNAKKSGYRRFYNQFKGYYQEREKDTEYTKGSKKMHIHLMALRKTVKLFLSHFWAVSRKMEGLSVTKPYPINKLKHKTYIQPFTDITEKEELIRRGLE